MGFYFLYELNHAALSPARAAADATRLFYRNPFNPLSHTTFGKTLAASAEVFERVTRRYGKPEFGIAETTVKGQKVPVQERIVWQRPFCNLIHFDKGAAGRNQPKLLIVAPMSGHYATLLRGTVEAMVQRHDVYITDWMDARMVPMSEGQFDLDDFIDYIINMLHYLGPQVHVMAVCQPSVPVLAATCVMERTGDPYAPASMILMGGPIDTRENPTEVNKLAKERGLEWFRRNVIMTVPFPHPGMLREVYPGFLQLTGFMSMNLDRHLIAHQNLFQHLVQGDGDNADKHKTFYDEYLAVMDLTAEFYLQTVETVFIRHSLPKGEMMHHGVPVDPAAIRRTALMTIEGENDDISGLGQTKAAHRICSSIPEHRKVHYMQPTVGHYGVFNGSRFRAEIVPRISDFISNIEDEAKGKPQRMPERSAPTSGNEPAASASDDLTAISGVGPAIARKLNTLGIFHFWQVARMSEADIERIEEELSFKGRIARDGWIDQARRLSERQTDKAS